MLSPQKLLTLQAPVLDGFLKMGFLDGAAAVQVGNRPRHLENAIEGSRRKPETIHRPAKGGSP